MTMAHANDPATSTQRKMMKGAARRGWRRVNCGTDTASVASSRPLWRLTRTSKTSQSRQEPENQYHALTVNRTHTSVDEEQLLQSRTNTVGDVEPEQLHNPT
jgi:hypothetical protein